MDPQPQAVTFPDPRKGGESPVGLIGFYYPGYREPCDRVCGASFLGNFYEMSPDHLELAASRNGQQTTARFTNSEAAYQALKFWDRAGEFESLSGEEAFMLKKAYKGAEDWTYGDTGGSWQGMRAVLREKFSLKRNRRFASKLLETGDAFLLEHNSVPGRDTLWSDNCDGEGKNWLGLSLMLLRDELSSDTSWTTLLSALIDLETGAAKDEAKERQWQDIVRSARGCLVGHLASLAPSPGAAPSVDPAGPPYTCMKKSCGKPTWNGQPNEFCSKQCKSTTPLCSRSGCGKPTFNGLPGEYCSKLCRDVVVGGAAGGVDVSALLGTGKPASSPLRTPQCLRPGCGKPTWNGKPGEFCSKVCKESTPGARRSIRQTSATAAAPPTSALGRAGAPAPAQSQATSVV